MHSWASELKRTGRALNASLFAGAMITTAVLRHSLETMHASTTEDKDIDKPKELANLTKWEKFWEQWKSYARRLCGAAKCPLSYVFHEHQLVDPAMHQAYYNDHDDRLINTTTTGGPWYELDNQHIYEEFKSLVLKGPGWSFIKAYDSTKNGRGAVLTLHRQCEGTSLSRHGKQQHMPRSPWLGTADKRSNFLLIITLRCIKKSIIP
jgi:hypothetical protein